MADQSIRSTTPAPHVSSAAVLRTDIDKLLKTHAAEPASSAVSRGNASDADLHDRALKLKRERSIGYAEAVSIAAAAADQASRPVVADPLLPGLSAARPLDVMLHQLGLLRSALLAFCLAARGQGERATAGVAWGEWFEVLWALLPSNELTEEVHGIALDFNDGPGLPALPAADLISAMIRTLGAPAPTQQHAEDVARCGIVVEDLNQAAIRDPRLIDPLRNYLAGLGCLRGSQVYHLATALHAVHGHSALITGDLLHDAALWSEAVGLKPEGTVQAGHEAPPPGVEKGRTGRKTSPARKRSAAAAVAA